MTKKTLIITLVFGLFISVFSFGQIKHALDSLIKLNMESLMFDGTNFSGKSWDKIKKQINSSQHVLIGEDHFTNEIPIFTQAIFNEGDFKNFFIEVDPYTTKIIENSIQNLNPEALTSFNYRYKDLFSFYAKQTEYKLLQDIVKSGTNLIGSDQIVMFSDRVIFDDLKNKSNNDEAKEIYELIANNSKIHLTSFLKDPQNNMMYMMTHDFSNQLEKLSSLNLTENEHRIIEDLKYSKDIYTSQSHKKRVRLIMNGLMNNLEQWKEKKTLFKYGANHLTRGESFLGNYDIGNLVANITESNYENSFHIMIVGESGAQGSPFRGFPSSKINIDEGFYLNYLKPFFKITKGNDWYIFNLKPIRKALYKKEIEVENLNLERTIRGYDILVIIPEVTPSEHD